MDCTEKRSTLFQFSLFPRHAIPFIELNKTSMNRRKFVIVLYISSDNNAIISLTSLMMLDVYVIVK
jgi:hypothetical protein